MHRTLTPENRVRVSGGVRADNANRESWRAQTLPSAGSSPAPRTRFRVGHRRPSGALTAAPAGSSPAPEAMPMRTACDSALVRRTARLDTGYRLHALVAESGRRAGPRCQWSARAVPVQVRASALYAPGSGDRPSLVRTAAEAGTRRGLAIRGGLRESRSALEVDARRFESGPRNTCLPSDNGSTRPRYGRNRSSILRAGSR
jgi:hypothetical protein